MNEDKAIYNLLTRIQKINDKEGKALLSGLSIKDINLMGTLLECNFITAKEEAHDQGTTFSHVQIKSNGIEYLERNLIMAPPEGSSIIEYSESQKIKPEVGQTVTFNTDVPSEVVLETTGKTKIKFLVTPNNEATILIGNDIQNIELNIYEPKRELTVVKSSQDYP